MMRGGRIANLAMKPLLSVEEAATLLGESRSTCYRSIERGDFPLPVVMINGRFKVPRRAVERLLDGLDSSRSLGSTPVTSLTQTSTQAVDVP